MAKHLRADRTSCWSSKMLLTLDGRPHGRLQMKSWRVAYEVEMQGRQRLLLHSNGWLKRSHDLVDRKTEAVLRHVHPTGFFYTKWLMVLEVGDCLFRPAGFLKSGYVLEKEGQLLAVASSGKGRKTAWEVEGLVSLGELDLLVLGLVYGLVQRQRQSAAGA